MMIDDLMKKKKMTKYRLAKDTGLPYTTVNDICSGKAHLEKCSAETIYKLSKVLNISMEALIEPSLVKRGSFELFKSNVCHQLKEAGDINYIIDALEKDDISFYFKKKWYRESFYLLAMLDYISRINHIPLCSKYDSMRRCRLQETVYPADIRLIASIENKPKNLTDAKKNSIPEFLHFNIVESEVRNAA
ncbi:MAG: helix-turn-helix transcriptional regulator [Solobacterium sp.]|nr:helix-turn-helix transcriptional regulator [Solobacterium sp.]MCH4204839.1 helix-turn-helix transcriptional regulator [Solobacterium sp.]MCH4226463.1 helix-turn-helix transcriptional regulator [Solobacterium sp.]MCH4283027.1 helix-turn-helix transcriptional regulator [Solobacterium sp.]